MELSPQRDGDALIASALASTNCDAAGLCRQHHCLPDVMADVLLSMIFCGVLERHPGFKVVIGEGS